MNLTLVSITQGTHSHSSSPQHSDSHMPEKGAAGSLGPRNAGFNVVLGGTLTRQADLLSCSNGPRMLHE